MAKWLFEFELDDDGLEPTPIVVEADNESDAWDRFSDFKYSEYKIFIEEDQPHGWCTPTDESPKLVDVSTPITPVLDQLLPL